jgi:hypothetical protein
MSAAMADLLISRVSPGVAKVRSADPFDTLEILRIDRKHWQDTPEKPGVYLLYGTASDGKLTVYIGMSETSMRNRIRSHHVNPKKNWFGTLFAVPIPRPLLCPAIEAELIGEVSEAAVVDVIANQASESRHRGADDAHVEPAVEKIKEGLQLVLGNDIFTPIDTTETSTTDDPIARTPPLARVYKGGASEPRPRTSNDPAPATHAYVGAGTEAWGRFEGDEPDKRFDVLSGSGWRRTILTTDTTTYDLYVKLAGDQDQLVEQMVLDEGKAVFLKDYVFDNWTVASKVVSGKPTYSGSYHWQRLVDQPD